MLDGNEELFLYLRLLILLHHMQSIRMQVLHGLLQEKVRSHMGCNVLCSHRQNMLNLHQMYSDAELSHNLYGLQFPTARPIQTGKGTLRL